MTALELVHKQIHPSWRKVFDEILCNQMLDKMTMLDSLVDHHPHNIFPKNNDIFRPFRVCSLDNLKVVMIFNEPYNIPGQSTGLPLEIKQLSSLANNRINEGYNVITEQSPNTFCSALTNEGYGGLFSTVDVINYSFQGVFLYNYCLTSYYGTKLKYLGVWNTISNIILAKIRRFRTDAIFVRIGEDILLSPPYNISIVTPQMSQYSTDFINYGLFGKINHLLKEPIIW